MALLSNDTQYHSLLDNGDSPADDPEKILHPSVGRYEPKRNRVVYCAFAAQSVVVIVLLVALLRKRVPECPINPVYPQVLYSPAQEALEYQPKTISMGFSSADKTIYQGEPSDEVDAAWHGLYNSFGVSKVPKWQAKLLPNKTSAIPGDEEHYVIGLSVFHQLHCLNLIRQGLHLDYYTDPVTGAVGLVSKEEWPDHLSHCMESIRQSLMCASDISLVVWQWSEERHRTTPLMNTVHSCRNFDKIVDWAKEHRIGHFNNSIRVEDDIKIPFI